MLTDTISRRAALKALAVGAAVLPLMRNEALAQSGNIELTYWGFSGIAGIPEGFAAAYPNIKVNFVNTGLGADQYLKLRNALKAGSGIPDVAECEYPIVPTFTLAKAFADLGPLGATELKGDYLDWAWAHVSTGDVIHALPWGGGPMILLYRLDIFEKYGLDVPDTWEAYEAAARKLKSAAPDIAMADMAINAGAWWNALFWQAGSRPFKVDGTKVQITINDEPAKRVLAYWQRLLDDKLVATQPIFTQDWFAALDAGAYATFPAGAWLLRRLGANAKAGMGKWRVATLPNWEKGKLAGGNWGGSSLAVTEASPNKKAAFELVKWMVHGKEASAIHLNNGLFPILNATLNDPALIDAPVPLLGGQPGRRIFVDAVEHVDHNFQFSPFQQYADNVYNEEFSAASAGKGTLSDALDRVQARVVEYAVAQGFTVS